jgi:hypothetical protein
MTINMKLAEMRGLSDKTILKINSIHAELDGILLTAKVGSFSYLTYKKIELAESYLQRLWGFDEDKDMHTWKQLYKFRCDWVGRVFECNTTEELFTIPCDVKERCFYTIGDGFLDVGVLDGYCRWGGIKEVVNNIN